VNRWRCR